MSGARAGPPPPPLAAFATLSVMSFVGPFLIVWVLSGGPRAGWPPDRAVEWWALGWTTGLVVGLLAYCVGTGLRSLKGRR